MSDRFKFRVWCPKENRWLHGYKQSGGCHIVGETILLGGWLSGVSIADYNSLIIEQSDCWDMFEIIGNIHENLELLDEKEEQE